MTECFSSNCINDLDLWEMYACILLDEDKCQLELTHKGVRKRARFYGNVLPLRFVVQYSPTCSRIVYLVEVLPVKSLGYQYYDNIAFILLFRSVTYMRPCSPPTRYQKCHNFELNNFASKFIQVCWRSWICLIHLGNTRQYLRYIHTNTLADKTCVRQ